ncbi:unnamed protein product [Sphagnum troendelagicum]
MAGGPKEGEICVVVDIIDGPTEEQEGGSTLNANKEREALHRIHEDPKLSRFLEEWETYLEDAPAHVESKNVNPIETNLIRCSQSWGPASLSLLASVATIASVYAKLKDYSQLRRALEEETNDSRVSVSIFREISLVEFLRTLVEMVLLCRRVL